MVVSFAVAAVGAGSTATAAGNDGLRITDFDIHYVVGADGGVNVTEKFDVRYSTPHHGLDRVILTGRGYSDSQHRLYPLSNLSVTSSTGAPANVARTRQGGAERLRIGDAGRTVTGTQQYTVKYHLDAVVNKQSNGTTEFHWNPFDSTTVIPVDSARITVKGPAAVNQAACWYGESESGQTCRAEPGATATFSASNVGMGRGMTIDSAMATNAFTNTAPILGDGSAEDAFGDNGPLTASQREAANIGGGVLAAALSGLGGAWFLRARRRGADERFTGVTPGETPASGQNSTVGHAAEPVAAVRFEPPTGVNAGLLGTIIDKSADSRDVAGTIVDLSVRGYLRMEQIDRKDWRLTAQQPPAGDVLLPYEATLLNALFADGDSVRLSDLRNHFSSHLSAAKTGLEREALERGWFKATPSTGRSAAAMAATGFIALALVLGFIASRLHLNPLVFAAGPLVLAGASFLRSRDAGTRSATGSAIYDQARGFELYLKTAEAKQFRFEEAEQIFSRYMPYAVVLGLADRWAKVFGDVAAAAAAQGYPLSMPYWYMPYGGYGDFGSIGDMGSGLESFGDVASTALASTPGSSGGSGFSGGGGFSGSGGGGGSVGGW